MIWPPSWVADSERLHGREAEILDEVLEVLRVGAVLDPGEAVVPARQDADAALVHLLERLAGDLELAVIPHLPSPTRG